MCSLESFSKERMVLKMSDNPAQDLADSLEYVEVKRFDKDGNIEVIRVY